MTRLVVLGPQAPAALPGTVVTLNRRAAARLGVRPLRLVELASEVLREAGVVQASPALSQRLLTGVVRQETAARDPGLTARAMMPAVRELLRLDGDLEALLADTSARVQTLARVALAYRAALRDRELIDGVEVMRRAAGLVQPQALSLTGHVRLLADERAFLNAVSADGSVVHLPWEDHPFFQDNLETAQKLEKLGWSVQRQGGERQGPSGAFLGGPGGQVTLHVLNSEEEEVRAALGQVKRLLLDGTDASQVVIAVQDDERWERLVRAVGEEYGLPIRTGTSTAASETRVGRWLLRVLQAAEQDLDFESVVRLLAHPLDAGLSGAEWQRVRARRPGTPAAWEDLGLQVTGLSWPAEAPRGQWTERVLALMDERGVTARAAHGQDVLALNFIRAELAVLGTPRREVIPAGQFMEELRDLLSLVTVPTQLGRQGVELLTPPALVGAEVAHVFILGLSDGGLPGAVQDDPVLDYVERRRLRSAGFEVETAASLSRRNAVTFWAALQAAGQVTCSYARFGAGSGLPSPYLAPLSPHESVPARHASSPEEARRAVLLAPSGASAYTDGVLAASRHAHGVEVRRLQEQAFDEFDGLNLPAVNVQERTFSASQLGVLGRCTFRWWLEYGLNLRETGDEVQVATLGRIRHAALQRAAERAAAERDQPELDVRESMLRDLDADWHDIEREEGWPQTDDWTRERPEHLTALRQAVSHPDFVTTGARPLAAEVTFQGEWMGFRVRGSVDRVDELGGDRVTVIDYKSGSSKPPGVQDAGRRLTLDLQLPIYAMTAIPAAYPDRKFGGAMYVSLRDGRVLDRLKLTMSEYELLAARLRTHLEAGAFPPRPDVDFKACRLCGWQATCRHGDRLERKVYP